MGPRFGRAADDDAAGALLAGTVELTLLLYKSAVGGKHLGAVEGEERLRRRELGRVRSLAERVEVHRARLANVK